MNPTWTRVHISGSHVKADVCLVGQVFYALPTCNHWDDGANIWVLEGDIVGDTAVVYLGSPDSLSWSYLYFDASGTPTRFERPEDTWCTLANGDHFTGSAYWTCD
jgi:hypothetical protein